MKLYPAILCLFFLSCASSLPIEKDWRKACSTGKISDIQKFMTKYPDRSSYLTSALIRIEMLQFSEAKQKDTVHALQEYIEQYPAGRFIRQANQRLDELKFVEVKEIGTVEALQDYLQKFPNGLFAKEAKQKLNYALFEDTMSEAKHNVNFAIDKFKGHRSILIYFLDSCIRQFPQSEHSQAAEKLIYDLTTQANDVESYSRFIEKHPDNSFVPEARKILAEKRYLELKQSKSYHLYKDFLESFPENVYSSEVSSHVIKMQNLKNEEDSIITSLKNGLGKRFVLKNIKPNSQSRFNCHITLFAENGLIKEIDYFPNDGQSIIFGIEAEGIDAHMTASFCANQSVIRFLGNVDFRVFEFDLDSNPTALQAYHELQSDNYFAKMAFICKGEVPFSFILLENVGLVHISGQGEIYKNGQLIYSANANIR